jgi:hypothetical protein
MKDKVIYFEQSHPAFPGLTPIKNHIPKWYKDLKKFSGERPQFYPKKTAGVKECAPFLDALTIGYTIELPSDMLVENIDGGHSITWSTADKQDLVGTRSTVQDEYFPVPAGFSPSAFSWLTRITMEIPSGYSILVTHPLNRTDLPFHTLSGVVDSFVMGSGSIPFFLRESFEGLIPAGTPIAQVIPFKRENWLARLKPGLNKIGDTNALISSGRLFGWYKQAIWKKKSYN